MGGSVVVSSVEAENDLFVVLKKYKPKFSPTNG